MIDFDNKGYFKLKQNSDYAEKVGDLILDGEEIIDSYKSMRDGVVFTSRRIIAINVQGMTGNAINLSKSHAAGKRSAGTNDPL